MSGTLDAPSPPPYTAPWMTHAGQQSSSPQYSKRPFEPVRLPGVAMDMDGSILSFGTTGLEPPPSYESRVNDGRVDAAK